MYIMCCLKEAFGMFIAQEIYENICAFATMDGGSRERVNS
jgi:hypothetical protein